MAVERIKAHNQELFNRVQTALQTIRPILVADGGDLQLVRVEHNIVYIRLLGACSACPLAGITLKFTIERELRAQVPEIEAVEVVA